MSALAMSLTEDSDLLACIDATGYLSVSLYPSHLFTKWYLGPLIRSIRWWNVSFHVCGLKPGLRGISFPHQRLYAPIILPRIIRHPYFDPLTSTGA